MAPRLSGLTAGFLLGAAAAAAAPAATRPVTLVSLPGRIRIAIAGRLFTEYVYTGASRPYCYPILAADGTPLTRDFPMTEVPGEDHDHPWHKALFFAHSEVDGVDFWNEGTGDNAAAPHAKGRIVQDRILETRGGAVGVLRVSDRWVAPDGRLVCTDERTLRFHADHDGRCIDFAVTLRALPDRPLPLGDNKDGTMAIRVAQWMTLPHKYGRIHEPGVGHILDANGDRDNAAWGKRADWCDYFAPHEGQTYGIAIFDHPQNLRHPTWWMARDYGLFGANPFGQHDYEHLPNRHAGDYTIPAGGSLTLRYRFLFHEGAPSPAHLTALYEAYAARD